MGALFCLLVTILILWIAVAVLGWFLTLATITAVAGLMCVGAG